MGMNPWDQFPLVGQLPQDAIYEAHKLQESGHQNDKLAVIANPAALQQKQKAQLSVVVEEVQHHFDQHSELFAGAGDGVGGQAERRINVLPSVIENGLQHTLLAFEMLQ